MGIKAGLSAKVSQKPRMYPCQNDTSLADVISMLDHNIIIDYNGQEAPIPAHVAIAMKRALGVATSGSMGTQPVPKPDKTSIQHDCPAGGIRMVAEEQETQPPESVTAAQQQTEGGARSRATKRRKGEVDGD